MTHLTPHYGEHYPARTQSRASFSIPSILAIICAIASFFFGAILGLLLAIAAIILGLIGVGLSLSPNVRGGMISAIGIFAGALGILAAIIKMVAYVGGVVF